MKNLNLILSKETKCLKLMKKRAFELMKTLLDRFVVIRDCLLNMINEKIIIEKELRKDKKNKENFDQKNRNKIYEPNFFFRANIKPQIYTKLNKEVVRINSSLIYDNKSFEKNKHEELFLTEKKNSIIRNNSVNLVKINDDDELYNSFYPQQHQTKKIIITKKDIDKELKLLHDNFNIMKKPRVQKYSYFLPKLSINSSGVVKSMNKLPYLFSSQNTSRKSKSTIKSKILKGIHEEEVTENEALPDINLTNRNCKIEKVSPNKDNEKQRNKIVQPKRKYESRNLSPIRMCNFSMLSNSMSND